MQMSETPEPQIGVIGFFDILGYASFLENNKPEQAAEIVLGQLLNLKDAVSSLQKHIFETDELVEAYREGISRMKWLVFSDTVLLALPYDPEADEKGKAFSWLLFLMNAVMLYRHMFDNGLPIRGTVSFGSFFIKGTCFAGRPIIEAYRAAQRMDLSCIALADSASAEMSALRARDHIDLIDSLAVEYLVPLKDSKEARLQVIPPSHARLPKLPHSDLRQAVAECFWCHNKDLSPHSLRKLDNTELFFRFFKMRWPGIFSGEPKKSE
jgi:hypothetical protein